MIRLILLLLLLLLPVCAKAGTLVVTITTATGACATPCTKTYTDTDANLARIVPVYQAQCNAKIAGTCTTPQVLAFWFDSFIAGVIVAVQTFEQSAAAASAQAGYVPINPH
jgi:hypothetical protein